MCYAEASPRDQPLSAWGEDVLTWGCPLWAGMVFWTLKQAGLAHTTCTDCSSALNEQTENRHQTTEEIGQFPKRLRQVWWLIAPTKNHSHYVASYDVAGGRQRSFPKKDWACLKRPNPGWAVNMMKETNSVTRKFNYQLAFLGNSRCLLCSCILSPALNGVDTIQSIVNFQNANPKTVKMKYLRKETFSVPLTWTGI